MKIFKNITFLSVTIVFIAIAGYAQVPIQIKVEPGKIQGTVENGLTIFRGIPFAAPPLGSLQWKAPQPANVHQPTVMYFAQTPHVGPVPDEKSLNVLDLYFKWRLSLQSKSDKKKD